MPNAPFARESHVLPRRALEVSARHPSDDFWASPGCVCRVGRAGRSGRLDQAPTSRRAELQKSRFLIDFKTLVARRGLANVPSARCFKACRVSAGANGPLLSQIPQAWSTPRGTPSRPRCGRATAGRFGGQGVARALPRKRASVCCESRAYRPAFYPLAQGVLPTRSPTVTRDTWSSGDVWKFVSFFQSAARSSWGHVARR